MTVQEKISRTIEKISRKEEKIRSLGFEPTEAYDIDWKESREAERAFNLAFDIRELEDELAELRATV